MKSRLSYLLISAIIISSIFTGAVIWRNKHLKEIPKFNEKSFTAPMSSQYIPKNADLVFHWKINPNILPNYIENYQTKIDKNTSNKKVKLIRDSSFNLISLDFTKDISKWAGEYGSFAIFDTSDQPINDWLIALEINKDVNINEEVESISSPSIKNEIINSNNNLNNYKSKIIAKKINSNKSIYFLYEKEHILISSNPKILKSSINELGKDELSIKEKHKNIKLRNQINDGILLLEMYPEKILKSIGQDKDLLEINQSNTLITSLNIENKKIIIEGILSYNIKNKRPINDLNFDLNNLKNEFNLFDNIILINNSKQYFGTNNSNPYKKLIASVIKNSTKEDDSNLFSIILKNTSGNFIWLKDNKWLAITRKADTSKKAINDALEKDKFSISNLEFKNKNLEIWSKISTNNNEKYEITENVGAITEENEDVYIWSQDLSTISNFDNTKYSLNNIYTDHRENESNDFEDLIKIQLGQENTEIFLNNFYPYILLKTMLGNKLNFPKHMDISLAIPTINYPDFVKFQIKLKTS